MTYGVWQTWSKRFGSRNGHGSIAESLSTRLGLINITQSTIQHFWLFDKERSTNTQNRCGQAVQPQRRNEPKKSLVLVLYLYRCGKDDTICGGGYPFISPICSPSCFSCPVIRSTYQLSWFICRQILGYQLDQHVGACSQLIVSDSFLGAIYYHLVEEAV